MEEEITTEAAEQDPILERAKNMGWRPLEEFRGNPDNFVSAEKFVELGETSLPHLKGTLKVMEAKISEQNRLIEDMKNDFSEFVEMSRGAEQRAYDKALADLKAQQQRAKAEGDYETFVSVTEEIDKKITEHPAVGKPEKKAEPVDPQQEYLRWHKDGEPAYQEFLKTEKWFTENPKMFAFAKDMDDFLNTKYGLTKSRAERLKEMTDLVKKEFPDHFGNVTARKVGSPVEGDSGGRQPAGNGKSYNDLPPDAQKQCDKWTGKDGKGETGSIKGLTRQQYLEQYKW